MINLPKQFNPTEMSNKKRKNTFLSFRIGKETFAVSVHKALEVLEKQYITQVPNVPAYIEGVINFRGKIIPVIDTRLKFKLPRRESHEKYVVIVFDLLVDDKKMIIGAMADSVQDVVAFDDSNILEVPELGFNYNAEFILGMLKNENSFTMILDIDKVFSTEELNIINQTSMETKEIEEIVEEPILEIKTKNLHKTKNKPE
jgi:purine-binding chemotaxis protein CheW